MKLQLTWKLQIWAPSSLTSKCWFLLRMAHKYPQQSPHILIQYNIGSSFFVNWATVLVLATESVAQIIMGFTEISHILDFLHELCIFRRHKKTSSSLFLNCKFTYTTVIAIAVCLVQTGSSSNFIPRIDVSMFHNATKPLLNKSPIPPHSHSPAGRPNFCIKM
jgi:hypothetical protein